MSEQEQSARKPSDQPYTEGQPAGDEPVWTYRGYELHAGEFTTAMVHFFRAEISRANVWRQRLDATTNWAVITTGAIITFAFSEPAGHHSVIILSTLLITLFLFIESRRYRYYELWSSRVRLMETDFFSAMLVPPFRPAPDWAESLAENLLQPHFPISMWEAFGRRFRRNFLWIYIVLGLSWLAKLWLQPEPAISIMQVLNRAAIGPIPGWIVLTSGVIFNGILILIGLFTVGLQAASGEVLPRYLDGRMDSEVSEGVSGVFRKRAWFRSGSRRQQMMAMVITDQAEKVADRVLADLSRGVTSLKGRGMYTGEDHHVLLCALTVTEVGQLKHLVHEEDDNAFVIVTPAQEVLGKGFLPLEDED